MEPPPRLYPSPFQVAPPSLIWPGHCVGAPASLAFLSVECAYRAADTKFSTGVTHKDLASRSERCQRRVAAGLPVIDWDIPDFLARGGIESDEFAVRGCHVNPVAIQGDATIGRV